jgi:hypothetical protein
MHQHKLLKALLVVAILLDVLTLPIWLLSSFFGGLGLPGLLFTSVLIVTHIRAWKSIRKGLLIPEKNVAIQTITGILLMLKVVFIVNFLSFEGDLTRLPTPQTILNNIAVFVVPSFVLYIGVLLSIKRYNKSLPLSTSTNQ